MAGEKHEKKQSKKDKQDKKKQKKQVKVEDDVHEEMPCGIVAEDQTNEDAPEDDTPGQNKISDLQESTKKHKKTKKKRSIKVENPDDPFPSKDGEDLDEKVSSTMKLEEDSAKIFSKSKRSIKEEEDSNDSPPQSVRKEKKRKTILIKNSSTEKSKSENNRKIGFEEEDASDSDDDELIAAAAAWADQHSDEEEEKQDKKENHTKEEKVESLSPNHGLSHIPKSLSLHLTQLPYDTNELDIRKLFAENGCMASSIRLVYDKDEHGRKTVFRGVAFVDLVDVSSYEKALKMNHKWSIRGRKLNIRPTRTKQELADIVLRTRELVQDKIRKQISNEGTGAEDKTPPKKQKKEKNKTKEKKAKKVEKRVKHNKPGEADKGGETPKEKYKLTKKERNRRAAILMGMKKKGRKK